MNKQSLNSQQNNIKPLTLLESAQVSYDQDINKIDQSDQQSSDHFILIKGVFTNQCSSQVVLTTNFGFCVFRTIFDQITCSLKDLQLVKNIENFEFSMGVQICIPNFKTNLFAIKLDEQKNKNQLLIWDNSKKEVYKQIDMTDNIQNIFFTMKKWLIVHTDKQIIGFDLKNQLKKMILLENQYKFSTYNIIGDTMIIAFIRKDKGSVDCITFDQFEEHISEFQFQPFYNQHVESVFFSKNSQYICCVSEGWLELKVFQTFNVKQLVKKIKLQHFFTQKIFDQQIQKIYFISCNIYLIYYQQNYFRLIDTSKKQTQGYFFKTYVTHDFHPQTNLWTLEFNRFTNPIVTYEIDYYDKKIEKIDSLKLTIFHLDGHVYQIDYKCRSVNIFKTKKLDNFWLKELCQEEDQQGFIKL